MNNDQRAHRIGITIFAAVLTVAITAALVTTIESVETSQDNSVAHTGTTAIAH